MPRLSFSARCAVLSVLALVLCGFPSVRSARADALAANFVSPPAAARPWVYWYFMDGNVTQVGMHADLEAMKKAGIGGVIFLTVDIGIPRGPVAFMSPEWQQLFVYAVSEAKRLGLQIALGTGPGWCGTGGPWVTPELSMQHLVASTTAASGPTHFDAVLPRPKPRTPFFGEGTLTADLRQKWLDYYEDTALIAFPTPAGNARIADTDHKALYYRSAYSSMPGTPPRIPAPAEFASVPADQCIPTGKIIDLTGKLGPDGHLDWDVPPGNWTIMRFGRTATGQTTRPAPEAGLGFESDKLSRPALAAHLKAYTEPLFQKAGPDYRVRDSGLTMLHFDSWEMGAQNWSPQFRQEFKARCGYDPLPYLPAMTGYVVGSPERSERFLWDLRHTISDLIVQNHARYLAEYAHKHGLTLSLEPYDLNPSADLDLGSAADLPMGEFWSPGWAFPSEFSCYEAVSVGHTNGKRVIGAESFTANPGEDWHQYPGSMKAQLDWALCTGINKFVIHRYEHQPDLDKFPGMTMGPYGVHWERTETWWDMVPAFHTYVSRCSQMLRQGLPVAEILYLTPEGAPQVFTPPPSALTSGLPDRKGYNFDGCSPENLIAHASVRAGRVTFPDGMSYRLLVLPDWETMTPGLLSKIVQLVKAGATVVGAPPRKSPSLVGYPACDTALHSLSTQLWGLPPYQSARTVGKGKVLLPPAKTDMQVDQARWIWYPEGSPASSAPVGTREFRTTVTIAAGRVIKSGIAMITADNSFELFVNGHPVGGGDDFHHLDTLDMTPWLKTGPNEIRLSAVNAGDTPSDVNPAGVIGAFAVTFADGGVQNLFTNSGWQAALSLNSTPKPAMELGPIGMAPWSLNGSVTSIYPAYWTTATLLKHMGVAPDFSADVPMRSVHRRLSDGDVYFVANASAEPIAANCTFRTAGHQPEWWNPQTGEMRLLPEFTTANGLTRLPVRLAPFESGFVVFRKPLAGPENSQANFPRYRPVMTLSRPWTVAFDPKWGGPSSVTFNTLDDWSKRPEEGIKYYSGKAVYRSTFDLPTGGMPRNEAAALSLGVVKNLASVRLNGRDLGIVWCDPWRVNIPAGVLKPTGNTLEVTVANLWINRLIGDSGKPQSERLTSTTGNDYTPTSPLQSSGLLGPVTLEEETASGSSKERVGH
jgi:hypothetical protein